MYCVFAKESLNKLGGNRGKMASMAGHAYLHAFWDAISEPIAQHSKYAQAMGYKYSEKAYKITLVVDTVDELLELQEQFKDICGTSLVKDAALTVLKEPTVVCLGLGPINVDNIPENLAKLKVLI